MQFVYSRYSGTFFNGLLFLYLVVFREYFIDLFGTIMHEGTHLPFLTGLVITLLVLEPFALYNKLKYQSAHGRKTNGTTDFLLFFGWMSHAVLTLFFFFLATSAIGYNPSDDNLPTWLSISMFFVVMKEIAYLLILLSPPLPTADARVFNPKEPIADAILIAISCLTFTAFWEVLASNPALSLRDYPLGEQIAQGIAALIILLIALFGSRLPFFLEEQTLKRSLVEERLWQFSVVLLILSLFIPLFY